MKMRAVGGRTTSPSSAAVPAGKMENTPLCYVPPFCNVRRRGRWNVCGVPWGGVPVGGLPCRRWRRGAACYQSRRRWRLLCVGGVRRSCFPFPLFPFSFSPVPAFVGRRGRRRSLCAAFAALRRTALHFENLLLTSTLWAAIMAVAVGRAWQRLCDNPNGKNKATAANKAERPQRGQERKT